MSCNVLDANSSSTWAEVPYFTMPFVSDGAVNPSMELGNGAYGNTTFWNIKDSIGSEYRHSVASLLQIPP